MRCLSKAEAAAILDPRGHSIRPLPPVDRLGARPPADIAILPHFIGELNRWLSAGGERLLWIDHWEAGIYRADHVIVGLIRAGLGESRAFYEAPGWFDEAPGYLFKAQNWAAEDQTEVSLEMARNMGELIGMTALVMMTQSDGWLLSPESADRIEFWESNFFFYSEDKDQIGRAYTIIDQFGCSRDLK
jgi:hypothetical protein